MAKSSPKTLKIDFHTHPIEALKGKMGIKGVGDINKEVAATIVKAVKEAGLNGIAITEHANFNRSWVTALEILDHFQRENLIILPGEELDYKGQQFLRIYIPEYYRRRIPFFQNKEWFLIFAHPGFYNPLELQQFDGINYDAVEERSIHGDFPPAGQIALAKNIPTIRSSDAHQLEDIGKYYTELEFGTR
jgi:histidinol phosphatase-like PHP family hydrolase